MNDEHVALVALLRRASAIPADRIEKAGSAAALLHAALAADGDQFTLLAPDAAPLLDRAAADIARWQARGYRLLSVLNSKYPANLREVHDRPPLLFVDGSLQPEDARAIAIIGSRAASDAGRRTAAAFATAFASAGLTVLSGLAAGIDTAAHAAALHAGGRTIAVIGTGLDHVYPPENAPLQRTIASAGAVVSQFWPETRPDRTTFPRRNAVMSGLSRGSLIIEAGPRSGARIQARHALAHGRPVFLHERLLDQPWARELSQRSEVRTVATPDDVIATP
jgi:DNA processing protein